MNYKNLEYFLAIKNLSEKHVQWILTMDRYNLKTKYRSDKKNKRFANVVGKSLLLGDLSDSISNDIVHFKKYSVLTEEISFNDLNLQKLALKNLRKKTLTTKLNFKKKTGVTRRR